jgi:hypothetical protein
MPSIISATLHFDASGEVVMTELWRDMIQGDFTDTHTLDYRISGNRVVIGCFRPIPENALCAADYSGTISGDALSLTLTANPPVIFNYKIAPTL